MATTYITQDNFLIYGSQELYWGSNRLSYGTVEVATELPSSFYTGNPSSFYLVDPVSGDRPSSSSFYDQE
jgi:hypothetical protein